MSIFCTPFDPSAQASSTLTTNLNTNAGVLIVLNDSAVNVLFTLATGERRFSPAQSWRRFDLPAGNAVIGWAQQSTLPMTVPNSQVYAEAFLPGEEIPEVFPAALVRATQITGGSSLTASEIINTGNNAPSQIIQAKINTSQGGFINAFNDGTIDCAVYDASAGAFAPLHYLQATPGGTSVIAFGTQTEPTRSTYYGQLDKIRSDGGALTSDGSGNETANSLTLTNNIASVDGIATAGSIGVPLANQVPGLVHITATTATQILSFTPVPLASVAMYRVFWALDVANGGAATVTLQMTYDDVRGQARTLFATTLGGTSLNAFALANGDYPLMPVTLMSPSNAANIVITYTDSTNTPNDRVQVYVERLI